MTQIIDLIQRSSMKILCARFVTAILIAATPIVALADPMPRAAQIASSGQVARAYVGKTDPWDKDCSGGIYFGSNGQARAWCAENSDSLGAGSWTADNQGRLCHQLTWYWPNGRRAGTSVGEYSCISHVVDRRGKLWRSWPNDSEWWPMDGESSLIRGYKFQSNVRQTRAKLGL